VTYVLDVRDLTHKYRSGERDLTVLADVTFRVASGTSCAIVGPSGSGKTTLLGLCAGLDRASSGTVILNGQPLEGLDEDERALLRRESVGFVFQNFQLIPTLSAVENVSVPLRAVPAIELPSFWAASVSAIDSITTPCNSPAVSSNVWVWRGPSSTVPPSSLPMSLRATSTPTQVARWRICFSI